MLSNGAQRLKIPELEPVFDVISDIGGLPNLGVVEGKRKNKRIRKKINKKTTEKAEDVVGNLVKVADAFSEICERDKKPDETFAKIIRGIISESISSGLSFSLGTSGAITEHRTYYPLLVSKAKANPGSYDFLVALQRLNSGYKEESINNNGLAVSRTINLLSDDKRSVTIGTNGSDHDVSSPGDTVFFLPGDHISYNLGRGLFSLVVAGAGYSLEPAAYAQTESTNQQNPPGIPRFYPAN